MSGVKQLSSGSAVLQGNQALADFRRWLRPFAVRHSNALVALAAILAVAVVSLLALYPALWIIWILGGLFTAGAIAFGFGLLYVRYRVVRFVQAQAAELASLRHMTAVMKDDHSELIAAKQRLEQTHRSLRETEERLKKAEATLAPLAERTLADESLVRRLNMANAIEARPINRYLQPEKRQRFLEHWAPVFGLNIKASALSYLAHKMAVAEDRCIGRLAAPVETALMRHFAVRSLGAKKLEVLEIGTLFGVAAGLLYQASADFGGQPHFTLLDPLAGYYGDDALDPFTGMPVNEHVLRSNLRALNVPDDAWRLIKRLSTEPEALKEAGDRQYDLILIDGDHSLEGVKADYELYGQFVKPGGLLIFDDYDTTAWPAIKPYVDEQVATDPRWEWIGGEYGTGILRRKA